MLTDCAAGIHVAGQNRVLRVLAHVIGDGIDGAGELHRGRERRKRRRVCRRISETRSGCHQVTTLEDRRVRVSRK